MMSVDVICVFADRLIIYIFIHENGNIKRKNTYIQKYTINKNESRNKEK